VSRHALQNGFLVEKNLSRNWPRGKLEIIKPVGLISLRPARGFSPVMSVSEAEGMVRHVADLHAALTLASGPAGAALASRAALDIDALCQSELSPRDLGSSICSAKRRSSCYPDEMITPTFIWSLYVAFCSSHVLSGPKSVTQFLVDSASLDVGLRSAY
jgi:hypothetical protein